MSLTMMRKSISLLPNPAPCCGLRIRLRLCQLKPMPSPAALLTGLTHAYFALRALLPADILMYILTLSLE